MEHDTEDKAHRTKGSGSERPPEISETEIDDSASSFDSASAPEESKEEKFKSTSNILGRIVLVGLLGVVGTGGLIAYCSYGGSKNNKNSSNANLKKGLTNSNTTNSNTLVVSNSNTQVPEENTNISTANNVTTNTAIIPQNTTPTPTPKVDPTVAKPVQETITTANTAKKPTVEKIKLAISVEEIERCAQTVYPQFILSNSERTYFQTLIYNASNNEKFDALSFNEKFKNLCTDKDFNREIAKGLPDGEKNNLAKRIVGQIEQFFK